jgi:NTE family protein
MSGLQACLALSPLFRDLDGAVLADLAARAQRVELASGSTLFRYGDVGDALYVVATGRLRASLPVGEREETVGDAGRGDVVGEIALVTGEPRTATVRAIRDSVLIRIGKQDVESLLDRHPAAMMQLARLIVLRLSTHGRRRRRDALRSMRTLALVPAHEGVTDLRRLAEDLAAELRVFGSVRLLDAAAVDAELGEGYAVTAFNPGEHNSRLVNWLNALEAEHRFLIYLADAGTTAWSARCLRQADCVLLLAEARHPPQASAAVRYCLDHAIQAPRELVLQHEGARLADGCQPVEWCEQCMAVTHHHLRAGNTGDVAHLARMLTGHALGVVLGGGGARGFAHLGLLRALTEQGHSIDLIGGTSIGALIAALFAQGRSLDDMRAALGDLFVRHNYLNDYSLSRVSLIGGRKFRAQLERLFGEQRIEMLPVPYFCISTNLTRGAAVVHDRGQLREWVASSMTIPGIGPPVVWRGDLLVDGGLLNNVPTDVMQELGRGVVIGSDVSNAVELRVEGVDSSEPRDLLHYRSVAPAFNIARILFRSATLVDENQVRARRGSADLYLRMPVQGVGTFDWEAAQALEGQAYAYARAELERFFAGQSETSG